METNCEALAIMHLDYCKNTGDDPDVEYLEELMWAGIEYKKAYKDDPSIQWHQVRAQWLAEHPVHSPRWGK